MGGIQSCTSNAATTCAVLPDGENGGESGGRPDAGSRSLIPFSRKKKSRGSGNKNKNKNAKTGNVPPKYQSCRDVLISPGQCDCCGKRHLIGNVLKQTWSSDPKDREASAEVDGICKDKNRTARGSQSNDKQATGPKSVSACRSVSNRSAVGRSSTDGRDPQDRQKNNGENLNPFQRNNESRPARHASTNDTKSKNSSCSKKTAQGSFHQEKKRRDPQQMNQKGVQGAQIENVGDQNVTQPDGIPDVIVDVPSGTRHERDCMENPSSAGCMLMDNPPDVEISKQNHTVPFDPRDYDHVKRDKNVGYILGKKPGDVISAEGIGGYAFTDNYILQSLAPTVDLVCLDETLHIYACDLGLSVDECNSAIHAAEKCAGVAGRYSAYTYAKQTLGCRDYDDLALECIVPTHVACQTIRRILGLPKKEARRSAQSGTSGTQTSKTQDGHDGFGVSPTPQSDDPVSASGPNADCDEKTDENDDGGDAPPPQQESAPRPAVVDTRPSIMVLDDREPHVVKYDTVDKTRQRLEMHTDKSEWTFLIALSEYGKDYEGGGTFFEESRTTYHLRRGTCLIFPGKLKHCGRKISKGSRFLLVGFLVEKKQELAQDEPIRHCTSNTSPGHDEDPSKQACSLNNVDEGVVVSDNKA